MTARKSSGRGQAPERAHINPAALPMSTPSTEPCIDSKTLLGEQGVALIRHEGLTYRLQVTRFGKLLLTK
jgi:hemin uptake protein HemP